MLTLQADAPPTTHQTDVERLFTLVRFISDQKAVSERLAALQELAAKSADVIAEAKVATADLEKLRTTHAADLKKARDAHDRKLAEDRAKFTADRDRLDAESNDRRRRADELLVRAKADADAAQKLRTDIESRLAKIKSAVA